MTMVRSAVVPRISIGLPVFNGENFLADALDSILRQSFGEFELIIADNASTDSTEAICRAYAARDPRIRYLRNGTNIGAAANHRLVLSLARAPFFKWQAHDDLLSPDFLARSLAALEAAPDAVLCITGAVRLDGEGRELLRWLSPLHRTDAPDPARRFGAVVRIFFCHWTELFGLMRRDAALRTQAIRPFRGGDIAFLAELALLGPFVRIDDHLFIHRDHPDRYYRKIDADPRAVATWYDPHHIRTRMLHKWALYGSHLAAVRRHRLTPWQRVRCLGHLLCSMAMWVNVKGLVRDLIWAVNPHAVGPIRAARQGLKAGLRHLLPPPTSASRPYAGRDEP